MRARQAFHIAAAAAAALGLAAGTVAAPAKKSTAKKSAPEAQPAAPAPAAAPPAAVATGGPRVPEAVKLRATTPAETEANAIWNVRAALNIAALQCQFLPFDATVKNYNEFLKHHSEQLDQTRLIMLAHFKRYDGAKAQASFDQYTTRTYNSFSTIDAQLPFCDSAGYVGRVVLATPKGKLGPVALQYNPELRASLARGFGLPPIVTTVNIAPAFVPEIPSA